MDNLFLMEEQGCAELGILIHSLRQKKGINRADIYMGLCDKGVYERFENGMEISDVLLLEFILSRAHIQKNYLDIAISDEEFDLIEQRKSMERLIDSGKTKEAAEILADYRKHVPREGIHLQYVWLKEMQIEQKEGGEVTPERYLEALELTMPLEQCREKRENGFFLTETEVILYIYYLRAAGKLDRKEIKSLMHCLKEAFLDEHICLKVYFELGLDYVEYCFKEQDFEEGIEVCDGMMRQLAQANREYYAPNILFCWSKLLEKTSGPKLSAAAKWKFQEAYYVALAYGEETLAEEIQRYYEEVLKWHTTD